MSGTLPWSQTTQPPPAGDLADSMQRIERNTAEMVRWVKILVIVIAINIVLDALIFVP